LPVRGNGGRAAAPSPLDLLAAIVESSDDAIVGKTLDGTVTSWNPAAERIYGYSASEAIGRGIDLIVPEEKREELSDILRRISRGERIRHFQTRRLRKDGATIDISLSISPIRDASGSLLGAATIARELTAVKRLSETLHGLLQAVEHAPSAVLLTNPDGVIQYVNPAFEKIYGFTRSEAVGKTPRILKSGTYPPSFYERFWKQILSGNVFRGEFLNRTKDGALLTVEVSVNSVLDPRGNRIGFFAVQADITERKRADAALREREARYRLLFDSNPRPMWVFDEKTLAFLAVNDAACRHYRYSREEFLQMTIADIRPPEDVAALRDAIAAEPGGYQRAGIWRHRKKDGSVIDVEIASHPLNFAGRPCQLVLTHDVTDRRKLEAQLLRAQKMEAIGQLAGGVAHDFNNLLTILYSHLDLIELEVNRERDVRREIEEIRRTIERGAGLTRQLLALARRQLVRAEVLDPGLVVADVSKMLGRLIGEEIRLETRIEPKAGLVRIGRSQLEQILMNLAVNARDAMPGGGRLSISVDAEDLSEEYSALHLGSSAGPHVRITVSDTGTGIDRETQKRIFEPFFTTKGSSKGTGLGLATVYNIVKSVGGNIWVYSEPGQGTAFKVYLPALVGEEAPAPHRPSTPAAANTGSETVLLLEDEAAIRNPAKFYLEAKGYRVLAAGDGDEAVAVAAEAAGPVSLLVTDVVLPGRKVREVVEEISITHPGIRILFMSGYSQDEAILRDVASEGFDFLEKPFGLETLATRIREILDRKA